MITLERAGFEDIGTFIAMEQEAEAREYVTPSDRTQHRRTISDPKAAYMRILSEGRVVGFLILVLEGEGRSVEFRRIVVSNRGKGIGQAAIAAMESLCRRSLGRPRIWLDVFEDNGRGRYIYEKLGYTLWGEKQHNGRKLLLYQKQL